MARNQSRFAEYDLLKEILPQIAKIDNFGKILEFAEQTCSKIFEQPEEPIVRAKDATLQGSQEHVHKDPKVESDAKSRNGNLKTHDKFSEAQTLSSSTSSPVPRISTTSGIRESTNTNSGALEAKDSLRHKKMHSKKRKIICKRML